MVLVLDPVMVYILKQRVRVVVALHGSSSGFGADPIACGFRDLTRIPRTSQLGTDPVSLALRAWLGS